MKITSKALFAVLACCLAEVFATDKFTDHLPTGPQTWRGVPSDYAQVEYIRSSSAQLIDTGVIPGPTVAVDFNFGDVVYAQNTAFFGQNWTGNQYLFNQQSSKFMFHSSGNNLDSPVLANTDYRCQVDTDGTLYLSHSSTVNTYPGMTLTASTDKNLAIFGCINGNNLATFTLYGMKIYRNDVLISDLVPVIRVSDNKPGLYDLVEAKFLENTKSAADFTSGEKIKKPKENPTFVSTGAQVFEIEGMDAECYYWSNATTPGTITIPEGGAMFDVLLVGGGGAGGLCRGGGGGGGGVVYQVGQTLPAGTYTVTVGAGGVPQVMGSGVAYQQGKSPATTCGGNSTITLASSEVFIAHGGGGGGNFTYQSGADVENCKGYDGASGGGAGGHNEVAIPGGAGIEGEGFAGGAQPAKLFGGGGGGGAGSIGMPTTALASGNGGNGRTIGITGLDVVYGGGGGGGGYSIPGGEGGTGGGGNGNYDQKQSADSGKNGLGGGGGGGGGKENKAEYMGGGAGGSGVVILRYSPPTVAPRISAFTVKGANYTNVEFTVAVSALGTGKTSATATVEIANDDDFDDIVTNKVKNLTGPWVENAYSLEITPIAATRYARLIVDNGEFATTSEVVTVSQEHAFVLSGCGYEYKNGGLEISALLNSVAAPSVTIELYVNDAASPSVTTNVTATGNVVMMLPGVSTATNVRVEFTAAGKSETQNVAAKPGSVQKVIADPSAHVTGVNAVVVKAGDKIVFPVGYTYECLDADRFITIDGNLVTTKDAGILAITQYDAQHVEGPSIVLNIEPADKAANARTFIWDESAGKAWNNPTGWKQVGVDVNEDYPNAATDLVFVPITAAKTLSVTGTNTVQDLYVGYLKIPSIDGFRLQGGSVSGNALKIVGVRTEGAERPGRFGILSSTVNESALTVRLGGNDANHYLTLIADTDLDFDFGGPLGTQYGPTSKHRYTKMYCSNTHLEIAEGVTVQYVNGQNHPTGVDMQGGWYDFCTDFLRGKGTFRMAMAGVFSMWDNHFRAFEGTVINSIRNNISQASSSRGGNIYSNGYNSPNSKLRLEGFVTKSYSITTSVGTFAQGSSHGYGGSDGFSSNGLPDAGVEFAGGFMNLFNFNKSKSSFWPREDDDYEVHNFTDTMTVDAGLTILANNASPSSTQPIDHFCASNIVHRNDGAIYFIDARTTGDDTTKRSITELHGMSDHYVGYTGAADLANNVFPIVPWMVARCGGNVKPDLWWAYADADSCLCRPGSRVNVTVDEVADPNRNVYSNGRPLALTADKTINSLSLNNSGKEYKLGEGMTLTITSGGLILNENGSSIGASNGGALNGSLCFPNRAYIYPTADSESNPNAIWTPITAPNGIVITMPGYFILGGDQTGIDTNIVINNGTTWLGAKDGSGSIAIDVPIKLVGGNTKLALTRAGVLGDINLYLRTAGGYSPKVEISAGVNETCNKFFVDGVTLPHGIYGATGSGAEIIDDVHFSGTGTLEVLYDELGTPILNDLKTTLVRELDASFTVTAAKGGGATTCDLYSLATKVSDGSVLTNLFATITEDVTDFPFVVSNLEDGVDYDISVWARNTKVMSGETYHFEAKIGPNRIHTYSIDYTPELSVDPALIVPTASTATIPWYLRTKGYQCELVSLKILYGASADALTQEKTLDPDVELGDNVATLDGLLAEHEYFAKIVAVNNKGDGWQGETSIFTFTNLSAAVVSGDGNELKTIGSDQIATFANNGTIKIPEPMMARVLLVGGGGAGGRWQGGGGAGGQVVEIAELELTPGEYTVTVGAGGIPTDDSGYKRDYSLGGTSSIMQNDVILAQAKGGGQGGNKSNTESVRNGSDGANGGGASYGDNSSKTGKGGAPTVKNGHVGGASYDGTSVNNITSGGGAGAGEDGQDGYCELNSGLYYGHGGNGGRGLASDITGVNVVYGGGGGGGVSSRDNQYAGAGSTIIATPGKGGEGGGGQGAGGNVSIGTYQWAMAGVDGLGGGGGGGCRYNDSSTFDTNWYGTAGGKGTVIIRFSNTEREPRVSAKATRADLDRGEVSVKLDYAGVEKSTADIYFACGTDSAALSPTLVQSALAQGAIYTYTLANPTAATTYYYKAFASNVWGRASSVIEGNFTIGGIAAGTGGTVTRQGDYVIQTFNSNGQLTLPNNVEADVLVLAGGGAGGHNRAGGGGAGGLIYRRGVKLAAGIYDVTVGAGGTPTSANTAGGNGGDSVLACASDELFRAVGGGGGGNYNQGDTAAYGNAGGSSGGNARRTITPMNAVAGQGHMGGLATYGNDWNGGGGGGAGGRGWEGVCEPANYIRRGGNGGVGVELDISGAFRWYAGGGGGGFYNKKGDGNWSYTEGGLGGLGGGGKGAGGNGETSSSAYAFNAAEAGTDGLGGGGGGGSHGESSSAPAGGGAGGKGVVVVRYFAPEGGVIGSAPVVEIREAKGNDNATITLGWKVMTAGANATSCTLTARYGIATNRLTKSVIIAVNASGEGTATLKGVKPGTAYYVQLEATNDRSVSARATSLAKVEIPKLMEYTTTRLGGADGFLQAKLEGSRNWSDSIPANETLRRELGAVMGYIQGVPGKSGTWQYTSPIDGVTSEWASLTTFGYQGYIYLNEGTLMRFGTAIDDYSLLKINGETLWDVRDCSFNVITYFYAEKAGWYPIEVRFGNDRNTAGRGTSGDLQYTGFGYSGALVGYKGNRAWAWYQPMEDGIVKMLSTGPAGRGFDAFRVSDKDGLFKASLVSSASTSASDLLYACYGETAAGDRIADWDHSEVVATLGTNVETNEYAVELTDAQAFVRFATVDSEGHVAWSKTFVRDVFKAPKIGEVHIAENLGDTLVFAGSLEDAGDTNIVMTLHYGTARNDRSGYAAMTTHPNEDGTFSISVNGLAVNTRYYYYWTAEAPDGGRDEQSGNETIVTAGSPVFSVWYDTRNQRLLQVHVEVTSVGAGGQVTLSLGIRKYDRKGSAAYTFVDAMTVTEPGEYILEWNGANETVFGEFMNYRVNLKNEAGSSKFENNSDGIFVFEDRLTYTWTGLGSDGKWNNPDNWSEPTGATDSYGYPAFMSDVIFPAGCNAEVILTEPKLYIHTLVFAGGSSGNETRVKLTGTEETALYIARRMYGDFQSDGFVTFNNFVQLTLDGAKFVTGESGGGITLGNNNHLTLRNGAGLSTLGNFTAQGTATMITLESGSLLASYTHMYFGGAGSRFVLDDSEVMVHHAEYRLYMNNTNSDDLRWIIKGRNPRINMARINTAKKPLPVDLVVPVGGYTSAPFRKFFQSKQTDALPCDSGSYEPFVFTVDPSSPALADNRTVTMPIFDCIDSLTASEFTLNTDTGISWAWSDPYSKGKNTWLSLTVAGQGVSAVTPESVSEPEVRKYGPYTIYSYTDASKVGVFTAAADTTADVLLVAGGGAGGWSYPEDKEYSSAGGGAGGLHEYKNVAITAGSYIVNVGRGGDNRPWDRFQRPIGMNGFDTSVFGYHVYGGGGGASLSRDWNASRGQQGGSGGGCCNGQTTVGRALVAGEGYAGGSGVGDNYGAGGGGAGGVGKNGKSTSMHGIATMNGDGGPGVTSDISGETREYAGGGGASATSRRAIGGSATHGGGCGGDRYCNAKGGNGIDGTGGGGGGGAWSRLEWQENPFVTWGQICGGKGGDGIVIIRARTESSTDVPYVAFRKLTAAKDGASVEWEYLEAGGSAAETGTSFKFVFTDTESGIAYTNSVAAGESYGVKTTVIGGLKSGTTYSAKILATNAAGAESPSDRATFTLTTLNEKGDGASFAGLIEGSAVGTVNDQSFDIRAAADAARQLGVVMGDRRGDYVSPLDGHVSYWQKKKTYGYSGYMKMKADVPYSFVGCFVYVNSIKVDGNIVLNRDEETPYVVDKVFTPKTDGWYPIEIRIGTRDSDWWGPYNSFSYGVAWTTNAVHSTTAEWEHMTTKGWIPFMDPGDGTLLRTAVPKARELSLAGAMWNGARTVLTATVNSETDYLTPLEVIACYGENYGDEDPSAWTTEAVAVLSAEETSATASFDNLPAKGYLRFMAYLLDANSNRTDEVVWSESIFLTEFDEHELEVPSVTLGELEASGTGIFLPVTILSTGSESDTCDVIVEYGTTDQLGSTMTFEGLGVGSQRLELTGLMPLGGYFVRVYATNSAGDSEKSAIKSVTTTALVEENGAGIEGFYQAKFEVGPNDATWITKTLADSVIPVEIVPYAGMADCYATKDTYNTAGYTNPNTGTTVHWNFSNSTFLYSGYLLLKAGEKITFGKRLDDAVYVKIGETVVINNTNWQTFSTGSFTAPADGYYPIEVRVADGSDGKGPSASEWNLDMGVAYNFINRTTLTPKSDWHRLNNDGDIRFFATIGTREVTVSSYSIASDTLTANLTFGEMSAEGLKPLYVAYGPAYGGIDTNAWAHIAKVGDFDETSSGTTYVGLSGLGTDVKYVRFFFDNGIVTTWSSSILLGDLTAPKLDHNSATVANLWRGDAFDASCSLVYDAGGTVTVQAEVSRTGTFADVEVWPMVLDNETGLYGVSIYESDPTSSRYIVPGSPVYVRFRATGAGAKSDVTDSIAVTPAASSAWANAAPTLSASHNRVTAKANLTTIGAHLNALDGTYVRAYAGKDPKNLIDTGAMTMLTMAGEASLAFDVDEIGVVWYVQLEYSNACSTATWTGRTTSGSITPVDAATYTWTGLGSDGLWSNPLNWSCSSAVSGGYPKTQSATAVFPNHASGTVKIDSSYTIGNFKLTGNVADITFTSLNLDLKNGYVQANFTGGSRDSKWTIDACTLKFTNDNIGWGSDSKRTASNNVVRVTNAGKFSSNYKVYFVGDDNTLIVEKGSTFEVTSTGHALFVGGDRTKVVIDDSYIFAGDRFYFNQGYNATGEQLVLKGAHPIVKARSKLQIVKTGDVTVLAVVPKGGFTEGPIQPYDRGSSSLGSLFSEGDANSKFVFTIDVNSPAIKTHHETVTAIVDWTNTKGKYIDTSKRVGLAEAPKGKIVNWVWTDSSGSEVASQPVMLKVTVAGASPGMIIYLR